MRASNKEGVDKAYMNYGCKQLKLTYNLSGPLIGTWLVSKSRPYGSDMLQTNSYTTLSGGKNESNWLHLPLEIPRLYRHWKC